MTPDPETEKPAHDAPAPEAPPPAPPKSVKSAKGQGKAVVAVAADAPETDAPAPLAADDVMPEATGRRDDAALALLFDACERFNVNPSLSLRPRELAGWRYYPADVVDQVVAAVVLVTAGGLKLKYFEGNAQQDAETEERLRATFRAYTLDPKTKERVPAPLPADLSLPSEAVLGVSATTAHRHPLGYLRRGR